MELERHTELSSSGGAFATAGDLEDWLVHRRGIRRAKAAEVAPVLFAAGYDEPNELYNTPRLQFERLGIRPRRAVLLSNVLTHTFENGVPVVCQRTEQRGSERPLIAFGAGDADATWDRDANPAVTARERNRRMMGDDQASPRVNRRNGAKSTGDRSNHPETEREGPVAPETDAAPCAPSCEEDTRLENTARRLIKNGNYIAENVDKFREVGWHRICKKPGRKPIYRYYPAALLLCTKEKRKNKLIQYLGCHWKDNNFQAKICHSQWIPLGSRDDFQNGKYLRKFLEIISKMAGFRNNPLNLKIEELVIRKIWEIVQSTQQQRPGPISGSGENELPNKRQTTSEAQSGLPPGDSSADRNSNESSEGSRRNDDHSARNSSCLGADGTRGDDGDDKDQMEEGRCNVEEDDDATVPLPVWAGEESEENDQWHPFEVRVPEPMSAENTDSLPPKRRGRPRKNYNNPADPSTSKASLESDKSHRDGEASVARSRKRKSRGDKETNQRPAPKRRGRPRKNNKDTATPTNHASKTSPENDNNQQEVEPSFEGTQIQRGSGDKQANEKPARRRRGRPRKNNNNHADTSTSRGSKASPENNNNRQEVEPSVEGAQKQRCSGDEETNQKPAAEQNENHLPINNNHVETSTNRSPKASPENDHIHQEVETSVEGTQKQRASGDEETNQKPAAEQNENHLPINNNHVETSTNRSPKASPENDHIHQEVETSVEGTQKQRASGDEETNQKPAAEQKENHRPNNSNRSSSTKHSSDASMGNDSTHQHGQRSVERSQQRRDSGDGKEKGDSRQGGKLEEIQETNAVDDPEIIDLADYDSDNKAQETAVKKWAESPTVNTIKKRESIARMASILSQSSSPGKNQEMRRFTIDLLGSGSDSDGE
eukprot:CAMPEP_0172408976 /NCGR_PEP_ID=MMETSP1061-20121228/76130_1 /TAXON_ID=37318 /ORGANISM="Pseudo-nitzschia pungens, Strain cf. pungens" /LENGTH=886 /DNA_ID=CAMNT_0013145121 /DNA_START=438 /DNA_END=3098 /DNA_ORIENTATION=+